MAWPLVAAAGIAAASSAQSAFMNRQDASNANETSWERMQQQYGLNRQAYTSRYRNTMSDMKSAGLNPILAATGGFNVGSSPQVSIPSTHKAEPMPNYASSAQQIASGIKQEKEAKLTIEQVATERLKQNKMSAEEKNIVQSTFNLEKEFELLEKKQNLTDQEIQKAKIIVKSLRANYKYLKGMAKEYEKAENSWMFHVRAFLKSLGIGAHVGLNIR